MIITLEGLDKQGKTSLANHISKLLNIEIVKFSQPKKEPYIEYMEFLIQREELVICDRFYLGERAYGPVKRGKSELNEWQFRNIEMLLMMRFPLCIFCSTNKSNTVKNFRKDNETYTQEEDIDKIQSLYMKEISNSRLEWIEFNYLEDENYTNIDRQIINWYKQLMRRISHIKSLISLRTLGNYNAKTLILGEISNIDLEQDRYKDINVPFANGPSARILYEAIGGKNVAITNVKKAHMNNSPSIYEEFLLPNLETIICLGNKAYEYIYDNKIRKHINVIRAYHPSYITRGGDTQENYNNIIQGLIV